MSERQIRPPQGGFIPEFSRDMAPRESKRPGRISRWLTSHRDRQAPEQSR